MKSGGRTQVSDVNVGRQILCREATNMRPTSQCARKLKQTVAVAARGLNAQQRLLWRRMVYVPALFEASRFSAGYRRVPTCIPGYDDCSHHRITRTQEYNLNAVDVLSNTLKFDGMYGGKYKWSQYLMWGAMVIKNLPIQRAPRRSTRVPVRRTPPPPLPPTVRGY